VGREGLLGLRPRPFGLSVADATLLSRPTASVSARIFDHRIKNSGWQGQVERGALKKDPGGGRSTSSSLLIT
jgi:hypothetical protein